MQNTFSTSDAMTWVRSGFDRVQREPARWLGMTLVYLAIALVFKRIPFLGNFILVLLTPIAIAGALIAVRSPLRSGPVGAKAWLHSLTAEGARDLFQVFRREEQGFAIVIVSIVTLGLFVLISIPELLITGGSIISGLAGASLAGPLRPMMIINMAVAIALYGLLAMALFYLVPLSLFGRRQAIPAVMEGFQACVRQRKALLMFIAPFLAVNFFVTFSFGFAHWLGYLLLAVVGMVSLPAFIIGLHSSYQTLFEARAPGISGAVKSAVAS
jgi:hypothetical protein